MHLFFLNHKGTVYSSEGLAENICTNAARIRKIMVRLKKAGLVETKEGIDGGYLFVKTSEETRPLYNCRCAGIFLCDIRMEERQLGDEMSDSFRYGGCYGRCI